jgi:hypothetical protein
MLLLEGERIIFVERIETLHHRTFFFVERASLTPTPGLGMARAVSRGSLTAEALVHLLTSPCEIGIGRSGIGTLFSPFTLVFPLSLSLHKCATLLMNKTNRCTEFQFYWYYDSTCFGQSFCPSSGVLSRTSVLVQFMQFGDRVRPSAGWNSILRLAPSDRTMDLGSTQSLVKMSTRNIPGGKGGRCVRPDDLTTFMC